MLGYNKPLLLLTLSLLTFATISCSKENQAETPIDKGSITIQSSEDLTPVFETNGGNKAVIFTASKEWTASVINDKADEWLSLSPASGDKGENTIFLTAAENTGNEDRSATVEIRCGEAKRQIIATQKQKVEKDERYVDLGLKVKWAKCNIGTEQPDEEGERYPFASLKKCDGYYCSPFEYEWTKAYSEDDYLFLKYSDRLYDGVNDNRSIVELQDDIVYKTLGYGWRIPRNEDWEELSDYCVWRTEEVSGTSSTLIRVLIGQSIINGNEIRFPIYVGGITYSSGDCGFEISLREQPELRSRSRCLNAFYVRGVYEDHPTPVSSISLDKQNVSLYVGQVVFVCAEVQPGNAYDQTIVWESEDPRIADVDNNGKITAICDGRTRICVSSGEIKTYCDVEVKAFPTAEDVDLGLSVNWSTTNLGALTPTDSGFLYSFGDINENYSQDMAQYIWAGSATYPGRNTKYTEDDEFRFLEPQDDAAHVRLGDGWRTPTFEEYQELVKNCLVEEVEENGVKVMRFTSKLPGYTDKSIIIPFVTSIDINLYRVADKNKLPYLPRLIRCAYTYNGHQYGIPIRPVKGDPIYNIQDILIDKECIIVPEGGIAKLNVTPIPYSINYVYDYRFVPEETAIVESSIFTQKSNDYYIRGVKTGNAKMVFSARNIGDIKECEIKVEEGTVPEVIDLGLSVKWASHNVGANKPEQDGGYFSWGEIKNKESYIYQKYASSQMAEKYQSNATLLPEDDVATVTYGEDWRMPTILEWQELMDSSNCTIEPQVLNGISGLKITSKKPGYEGNHIFLPITWNRFDMQSNYDATSSSYWSSNAYISTYSEAPDWATGVKLSTEGIETYSTYRASGLSVRAVYIK